MISGETVLTSLRGIDPAGIGQGLVIVIMGVCVAYLAAVLALTVHELGHFLVRKVLRTPTSAVDIGTGPVLCRWGQVRWRLLPLQGQNWPKAFCLTGTSRCQKMAVYLSGAGANVIGVAVLLTAYCRTDVQVTSLWFLPWFLTITFQAFQIANLIPARHRATVTDGLFIIALWHRMDFLPPDHPCGDPPPETLPHPR